MKRIPVPALALLLILLLGSCKFSRTLKNPDVETKFKAAMDYYNTKDYSRALQLFDQLIGVIRTTGKAEDLNYYYSYCYYYMKDYTMASYYFKRFYTNFPGSTRAEEALYMAAYCNYQNSPEYSLDQSTTYEALKDLQLFINIYPKSKRVSECNDLIDDLRAKLEYKDYRIARLYFRMGDYNAAITCYNNILKDYPETPHKEELMFLIMKTYSKFAKESIELKKKERYNKAILAYNDLLKDFPETQYRDDAKVIYDKCNTEIQALSSPQKKKK
jgi:outer membrane protein assembly factor BamD